MTEDKIDLERAKERYLYAEEKNRQLGQQIFELIQKLEEQKKFITNYRRNEEITRFKREIAFRDRTINQLKCKDFDIFSRFGCNMAYKVLFELARLNYITKSKAWFIFRTLQKQNSLLNHSLKTGIEKEAENYKQEIKENQKVFKERNHSFYRD